MRGWLKFIAVFTLLVISFLVEAQTRKPVYNPCFLLDSIDRRLEFIKLNAFRIFADSFDCRQTLMDSIGSRYLATKSTRYLDFLAALHQNPAATEKVANLYPDLLKRFSEDDFPGFVNQLYLARGRYAALEKELIAVMNMIVNDRPYKLKYLGLLNVEIGKAKDAGNKPKQAYLEKLKLRIEEEKYR